MKKVQEVVRSMPWARWIPGYSKCYRDVSYTKTKEKVRFKFVVMPIDLAGTGMGSKEACEAELKLVLMAEGHEYTNVFVYPALNEISVYQAFELEQPARRKVPLRGN